VSKNLQAPVFSIAAPIQHNGKVIGVLVGATDLNKPNYLSKITDNRYGKTGGYLLVSPNIRTVVYATDKKRIMQVLPDHGVNPFYDKSLNDGWEGSGVSRTPSGVEVLVSIKHIPASGWNMIGLMPTEEAFAPVHDMQKRMLLAAIFLTLLAGSLTWWMLKRQLEPVFSTMKTLASLSDRDGDAHILPITRQDEIGELIGGFNNLLESLGHREKALKESEKKFRAIIEVSPVPFALNDNKGNITFLNEAFISVFGYTLEDIPTLADWWLKAYPDPDYRQWVAATWQSHLEKAKREGKAFEQMELRIKGKDNLTRTAIVGAAALEESFEGTHLVILYDITERKRVEEELRKSQALLNETGNLAKVGGWEFDVETMELTWTEEVYCIHEVDTTNYKPSVEKAIAFYTSASKPIIEKAVQRAIEYGEPFDLELDINTAKANHRWVHAIGKIGQLDGKNKKVKGIFQDITERKQAEDELRKSNELFSLFMHHSPIYTFIKEVTPIRSLVLQASDNFRHMIGISGSEMVGKTMEELFSPEFAAKITADDWAVVSRGDVLKLDEDLNGRSYTTIKFPVVQREKTLLAGYTIDNTDRKQAEEEKAKLEQQLHQSQRIESVGRLAGGVAHDFNNMLGVILGHAEIALDKLDANHPLHTHLQEIHKAAERSSSLTRQLLAFARKQTISPQVLDLNETVAGMLNMLQRLIGEDIHQVWLPGVNLWPVKVDPSQIDQVLANLCVNARDAMTGIGKVTIETRNISFDEGYCADHAGFSPGEYVSIAVSDNGCGMDQEILGNIFEPFFTTKGIGKGTGLGLAMVHGVVKQNNGFINVYSEPGQGTTFKIYLPRYLGRAEPVETVELPAVSVGRSSQETILVVEDELSLLELSKIILEGQGYRVLAADTPGEAIRLAEEHDGEIHLLMTDVVMPEMNGRDLSKRILSVYPGLKRLFMSGYTANVIAHHGILDEGVHFIQKPFSRKDLTAKVREALDTK